MGFSATALYSLAGTKGLSAREVLIDFIGLAVITVSLLVYGVLQERIMTIGFGPQAEIFEHSIFLVLCNRLATCVIAFLFIAVVEADVRPAAHPSSYALVSFTNVVATSCQYEALKYVSFAIQTLAKSSKVLPVMIWGAVFGGKRYRMTDYLHAATVMVGCSIFILAGDVESRSVRDKHNPLYYIFGAGLLVVYLAVDGLTSTWQDTLFSTFHMSICDQVLYTTAFSTLLSFVGTIGSGQLLPSILFIMRNPDALWYILALSACSAAVQLIISFTIKRYGAVVFATIMTTRQFFSILLSSVVFMTPLQPGQWVGLAVVFGALFYKMVRGGNSKAQRLSGKPLGKGMVSVSASPAVPHGRISSPGDKV